MENQHSTLIEPEGVSEHPRPHCELNVSSLYNRQSLHEFLKLDDEHQSPIAVDDGETALVNHSMRPHHRASTSSLSNLMEWNVLNQHGLGLDNHGKEKHQQNKCYLNSIIQCLANTAPFAQWLLCDGEDAECMSIKSYR